MTSDKNPRPPEGGQALKNDNTYQFDNQGLFETKGMRVARAGEMWEWENESLFGILGEINKLILQIVEG